MASPELPSRTYRITKVPLGVSTESIREWFTEAERRTIIYISRALSPGNRDPPEYVFTITFDSQPSSLVDITSTSGSHLAYKYLSGIAPSPREAPVIDAHFRGLTVFNNITDEDNAVDIVGVTGLAGRPFGSWQYEDGSMWLRDYLPNDIPNVSVSVFGYSSKLVNSDSHATLRNFSDDFLDRLATSREFRPELVSIQLITGERRLRLLTKFSATTTDTRRP
ncbi:hypothetical protein F4861DRAFT_181759 [Xylaria intraflava]|nr:hypothetical protein F4861DRAFT_181759 [Xylaria intraflava]